jgi:hypothetical protein
VIDGKLAGEKPLEDAKEGVSSYWTTLRKTEVLETERGSTRSYLLENSLWKRLRTCLKTDYKINEYKHDKSLHNFVVNFTGTRTIKIVVIKVDKV